MRIENTVYEFGPDAESYTLVSAETLENVFPAEAEAEGVEISLESAPPRDRAEARKLAKTVFFKRR